MSTPWNRRASATTFLAHCFGRGLVDEACRYAVARFVSLSNGDTCRRPAQMPRSNKARGWPKPERNMRLGAL